MTDENITILPPEVGRSEACERILRELPKWFGIEESLLDYVEAAKTMPTLLAMDGEEAVGFLTINRHFPESAEVFCTGLLPSHHRRGIGSRMQAAAEEWLVADDCRFLQVKTLAEEAENESYALTRKFYRAMGFAPLEMFPELWDEWNPCLVLVKDLGLAPAAR